MDNEQEESAFMEFLEFAVASAAQAVVKAMAELPKEAIDRLARDVTTGTTEEKLEEGRIVVYVNAQQVCSLDLEELMRVRTFIYEDYEDNPPERPGEGEVGPSGSP